MHTITRRQWLTGMAAIAAPAIFRSPALAAPLPTLPNLPAGDALLLRPGDAGFTTYRPAFNARVMVDPQLRAMCKTAKAVSVMVDWCRSNNLAFALRSGGHCYEGFSQSDSVVIDTRMINRIVVDAKHGSVRVGAGATLGAIYTRTGKLGFAIPAGSCPTVGVAGHALGGGYGFLARPLGLACDSVQSIDLVDAQGKPITADAQQHPDLFWACRGGGGGSFGAVTGFRLQMHAVPKVVVFGVSWQLAPDQAADLMKMWQAWAPTAPSSINALFRFSRHAGGDIALRCFGQSTGTMTRLRRELKPMLDAYAPSSALTMQTKIFLDAVKHFAPASEWIYQSAPMKGKSDYVMAPLGDDGLAAMMNGVAALRPGNAVVVICDPYGGAIADTAPDATAFAHRTGVLYGIQYASTWSDPNDTTHLDDVRTLYASMRPYMPGAAYVNYCDMDLTNWPDAYWGANLARLKQIKAAFDPDNVFRHGQSVPGS